MKKLLALFARSNDHTPRKISKKVLVISIAIFFLLVLLSTEGIIYFFHDSSYIARMVARITPFPVVVVDGSDVIFYGEIVENMKAVRRFYESQDFASQGIRIDFSTPDGKKRLKMKERELVNKLIEDRVVENFVRSNGKSVSNSEVSQNIDRLLAENGGGGMATENIRTLYGWSMDDFAQHIVDPSLYREKAEVLFREKVKTTPEYVQAKKKIEDVSNRMISGEVLFSDAARLYSEGSTSSVGGRIGWVKAQNIDPAVAVTLQTLKIGQRSDVIEGALGFHIILLQDTKKQSEDLYYDISQIFVRKPLLANWLDQEMKKKSVWIFFPEYRWNPTTGYVEFKDSSFREFEKRQAALASSSEAPIEK